MARLIKTVILKKRGRPATGKDPLVSTRMPVGLIGEIDRWADCSDVKRSEAIRRLVELGLASIKPKAKLSSRVLRKATSVIDALASDLQNAREKTKAPPTGK